jgi:peptide/nickel transport system permease protein
MRWRSALTPGRVAMLAVLCAFLVIAVIGPPVWGGEADAVDLAALSQGASGAHPFGTDALGRDMLARTLVATRLSLALALAVTATGFALGLVLGVLPLLFGRRVRRLGASAINVLCSFPSLLLALLVITIVGVGWIGAVLALAVSGAPQVARVTQTLAAQVVTADYVVAARGAGVRIPRLLVRHVLPNIGSPLALQFAWTLGAALLALSALSFLGVGVQEPDYDWGALLGVGLERIYVTPAAALGPAAAIVLASLAFNVLGDALGDALAVEAGQARKWWRAPKRGGGAPARPPRPAEGAVLRVDGLSVSFGALTPVHDVSFALGRGERLGIVGESGSGKSLTALAGSHLIEPPGTVDAVALEVDGVDPRRLSRKERMRHLATSMAMVFQDPLSSLNPALRVGRQVTEAAEVHLGLARDTARERATERFRELAIAGGARRLRQYPHELSGGMRQRAVIAMGLMTEPRVIVADEPTSALDVTVQRQVLRVLHRINAVHGTAIVLISHDISVIRAFCDRVLVMYAGRVVEELPAGRLDDAAHPYTRALLAAIPTNASDRARPLAALPGQPPSVGDVAPGCSFAPRCAFATDHCRAERPQLAALAEGHRAACWHPQRDGVAEIARETA